ncbi:MAG: hypothetical protein JKY65_14700 [Planctomycetes bacterium]|nr:hypothetical protein [Planctomycetota bacterium]
MTRRHLPARSPLADLGWLRGLPRGVAVAGRLPWLAFPTPGQGAPRRLVINAEQTRAADRALAQRPPRSRRDRALYRRSRAQLQAIEHARTLGAVDHPRSVRRDLSSEAPWEATPHGRSCAAALSWLNFGAPHAARRFEAANAHAAEVLALLAPGRGRPLRLRAALALADLLVDLAPALEPLLVVLRASPQVPPGSGRATLDRLGARLDQIRHGKVRPSKVRDVEAFHESCVVDRIASRVLEIHALPRAERTAAALALEALPPWDEARRRDWWTRCHAVLPVLRDAERRMVHAAIFQLELGRLERELANLRPGAPEVYLDAKALEHTAALAKRPQSLRLLLRTGARLSPGLRGEWYAAWFEPLKGGRAEAARRAIPVVGRWLERPFGLRAVLRLQLLDSLDHVLHSPLVRLRRCLASLEEFLSAARGLNAAALPPVSFWNAGLRGAARREEDPRLWGQALVDLLVRRPSAWTEIDELSSAGVQLLAGVCGSDSESLAELLGRLTTAGLGPNQEDRLGRLARALIAARGAPGRALAFELLTREPLSALVAAGLAIEAVAELGGDSADLSAPAAPEASPAWIATYPESLHDLLKALAVVEPRAETGVARTLRRELPSPRRLKREILVLQSRVRASGDNGGCYQRLQTLEHRLRAARVMDGLRLKRCRIRLTDRLRRACLAWIDAKLQASLMAAFQKVVPGLPESWLEHPKLRPILLHLRSSTRKRRVLWPGACSLLDSDRALGTSARTSPTAASWIASADSAFAPSHG